MTSKPAKSRRSVERLVRRSPDLIELLDHCEAALTAAGVALWDSQRDLAIACNQRAQRCRIARKELAP